MLALRVLYSYFSVKGVISVSELKSHGCECGVGCVILEKSREAACFLSALVDFSSRVSLSISEKIIERVIC